jgi:hypothetical protein
MPAEELPSWVGRLHAAGGDLASLAVRGPAA